MKNNIFNLLLTSSNLINVIVREVQVLKLLGTGDEIEGDDRHCIVRQIDFLQSVRDPGIIRQSLPSNKRDFVVTKIESLQ